MSSRLQQFRHEVTGLMAVAVQVCTLTGLTGLACCIFSSMVLLARSKSET